MASHTHATAGSPHLPLLISIGFAGSRFLLNPTHKPSTDVVQSFENKLTLKLQDILKELPSSLRLTADQERQHFFCGISQLAIGADECFTRACQALEIPQRLFLPLPWDAYSTDIKPRDPSVPDSKDEPDFTLDQKNAAAQLLTSPHIIQQRIISRTDKRDARFEDVNLEIVIASDVIIAVVGEGDEAKRGGTQDLINLATKYGKPLLKITVTRENDILDFALEWQQPHKDKNSPWKSQPVSKLSDFHPPALPHELDSIPKLRAEGKPPAISTYLTQLEDYCSKESKKHSTLFKYGAVVIIVTHLLATAAAATMLALPFDKSLEKIILSIELAFLALGFLTHQYLHSTHAVMHWAFCRLVAQLADSVRSIGARHIYLEHLFSLPFPHSLRPLLRTLNTLHLHSTNPSTAQPPQPSTEPPTWDTLRNTYISTRLEGDKGQLAYYRKEAKSARTWLPIAQWAFTLSSLTAFGVSALKLWVKCDCPAFLKAHYESTNDACGIFAILFPVLAVGCLSLAAALDLEARAHTFEDMVTFLDGPQEKKKSWWQKLIDLLRRLLKIEKPPEAPSTAPIGQIPLLKEASSEREYDKLLLETESRLLGETVNWFSRRSFTGVA